MQELYLVTIKCFMYFLCARIKNKNFIFVVVNNMGVKNTLVVLNKEVYVFVSKWLKKFDVQIYYYAYCNGTI